MRGQALAFTFLAPPLFVFQHRPITATRPFRPCGAWGAKAFQSQEAQRAATEGFQAGYAAAAAIEVSQQHPGRGAGVGHATTLAPNDLPVGGFQSGEDA